MTRVLKSGVLPLAVAVGVLVSLVAPNARQGGAIPVDADDLAGTVTSAKRTGGGGLGRG